MIFNTARLGVTSLGARLARLARRVGLVALAGVALLSLPGCGSMQSNNPSIFNGANTGTVLGGGGAALLCTSLAKGHPITMVLGGLGCGVAGGLVGRMLGNSIDNSTTGNQYQVSANQLPMPGQVAAFSSPNGLSGTQEWGSPYARSNGYGRVACRDGLIRVAPTRDFAGRPTSRETNARITVCETRPGVYEVVDAPSLQRPFDPNGNVGPNYRNGYQGSAYPSGRYLAPVANQGTGWNGFPGS